MSLRKSIITLLIWTLHICSWAIIPQRIVSLSPSITKDLHILNVQDKLVGCTSYCQLAPNEKIEICASAVTVNIEKVVALKPDIVFANSLNKPDDIRMLEKMGIKVVVYSYPKSFTDLSQHFLEVGELVGKSAEAKGIIKTSEEKIKELQKKIPANKKPKVFIEIGANPLFTAIPNTYMHEFITFAGGINIANDLKSGSITREAVILKNPDVIIVVTMGIVGEEEKEVWEKYPFLSATKNKKIFVVDSYKTCSPTPVEFTESLELFIKLFY